MYKWARRRNIYMLSCPTTYSGKGLDELERENSYKDFTEKLIDLYVEIYMWNIRNGITTIEEFLEDGVSLYPGCHVCNQITSGFYLNLSGQVTMCPGRVDEETIFTSDIRQHKTLTEVWKKCSNYNRYRNGNSFKNKKFNFLCPPRNGYVLRPEFYDEIYRKITSSNPIE